MKTEQLEIAQLKREVTKLKAEQDIGLHVADHGLDGGSTSQFALDGAEDAALLSRDKDAPWILRVVPAVSLST